jgi:peptide deformylase
MGAAMNLYIMQIIRHFCLIGLTLISTGCASMNDPLPDYVDDRNPNDPRRYMLNTPSATVDFPLSEEDKVDLAKLEAKFDQEENCAGLAAPQIGIHKRMIVFMINDPELKKWRKDLTQLMPRTVWINPDYEPVTEEKTIDYEGCFSVSEVVGPVARFKEIYYTAYTPDGSPVRGKAEGFLARAIQHEIDHTKGILYSKLVPEGQLLPLEEYRARRKAAMEAETKE